MTMGIEVLLEEGDDGRVSSSMMIPKPHQPQAALTICNVEVSLQVQSYHFSQVWSDCESASSCHSDTETEDGGSRIVAQEDEEKDNNNNDDDDDDDDDGILATASTTSSVSSQGDEMDNETEASVTNGVSATSPTTDKDDDGGGTKGNTIDDHLETRGRTISPEIIHPHPQQQLRHFPPSSLTVENIANVVGHSVNNGSISGHTLSNDYDDKEEETDHSLSSITSAGSMLDSIVNWNANQAPKDAKQQQRYSDRQRRQTTRVRVPNSYVPQSSRSRTTKKSGRPPRPSGEDTSSLPGAFRECDGGNNNNNDDDNDDDDDEESQRGFEAVATHRRPTTSDYQHHHDEQHSKLAIIVPLAAELAPQIEELIAERDALRQELEYSRKQLTREQKRKLHQHHQQQASAAFSRSSNNTILAESVAIVVPNEPTLCDGNCCDCTKWNKCSAWICCCIIVVLTVVVLVLWKRKIL
jgi:hypothetical protein